MKPHFATVIVVFSAVQVSAQPGRVTPVEVMPVLEEMVRPTIELVGTVRPQQQAAVASEIAGIVSALPADEGDFIKKGELICRLRSVQLQLSLEEASSRVLELRAALEVAKAEETKAKFEYDRTERLRKLNTTTEKEWIDAKADHQIALSRIQQAESAIASAEATEKRLKDSLERTTIVAPFDGYVVTKHIEVGEWVSEGGGVVDLIDLSTVRVRVSVPEAQIAFCKTGQRVQVVVEEQGRDYVQVISRVIPLADEQARSFPIDIDIKNPEGVLKAGMFVRADVPAGAEAKRLIIPKNAIVMRGPVPMLFVVRKTEQGEMAEMLPVRIVHEVMDHVAVEAANLSAGDLAIVRGNEFMRGPGPVIARPAKDVPFESSSTTTQPALAGKRDAATRSS